MASRGTGSHRGSDKVTSTQPTYACFECTLVLVCGYSPEEIKEIKATVEAGGGKVYTKFAKSSLPQVVVCGSAGDKTYRDFRKQTGRDKVPAVTKQWVEDCNRAKGQVCYAKYELKTFTGLSISITNFNQAERRAIQTQIEKAGGLYSAELYKDRCTHLVCKTATGNKFRAARQWQGTAKPHPHVVSEAWVHDSLKLGHPAPEEEYPPPSEEPCAAAAPVPSATPAVAASATAAPAILACLQGGVNSNDSWVTASSGAPAVAPPSGQQQQQQHSSAAAARVRTTRSKSAAAAAAVERNMPPPDHQQQQQFQQPHSIQQQQQQQVAAVPAEPVDPGVALAARYAPLYEEGLFFLERVQLWWCGISSSEQPELRHKLFAFGGVWIPKLNENITHIMIGSQASRAELLDVKQYLQSCKRRVEVVSPAWLHFCMTERQLVADKRGRLALAGLLNHMALGSATAAGPDAAPAAAPVGNVLGGVFSQSASRTGFPETDVKQHQGGWEPEYWLHQPRAGARVFEGCYFTLAALKGQQKEHQEALEKIRTHGGQIFNHGSTKPAVSCPTVFAVCPASLPTADERQLTAADSSFRAVHHSCRVTVDWLMACVERHELVRISSLHTPLFGPTRHTLPLAGFDKVSVLISGYPDFQRKTIQRMAQLLGAKVLDKTGKHSVPSHLIIPRWGPDPTAAAAANQEELGDLQIKKIRFAQRHNVQMVHSFWLAECMSEGRRVTEEFCRPEGEVQLLPAAAAGETQAGGLSQLTQTQRQGAATKASAVAKQNVSTAVRKCPLPSCPPSAGVDCAAVDDREDAAGRSSRPSNWFMAGASRPSQQQQSQPPAQQQQQQQQQQNEGGECVPHLRKTVRKILESPEDSSSAKEDAHGTTDQRQQQQQHERDQRQQPSQQQESVQVVTSAAVACSAGAGAASAALADVGNTLQSSPPESCSKVADHLAPGTVAVVSGAVGTTTAGVLSAVAAAAAPGGIFKGGSDGDEDPTLSTIMSALGQMASKHDLVEGSYASQSLAHMPSLQQLSGKVGSGGLAAPASNSGDAGGSSGAGSRKKRKAVGESSGCGVGKGPGSGHKSSGSTVPAEGSEGKAPAAAAGPAGEAKRPRRSGTTAAAASGDGADGRKIMPPPSRPVGKASGACGSGGNRYCPKKGSVAVQESMQMSQQVDYDSGQQPETLLAAAGRRRGHSTAADVKAKRNMLARVGQLNK